MYHLVMDYCTVLAVDVYTIYVLGGA
jgi:hypothetical protein